MQKGIKQEKRGTIKMETGRNWNKFRRSPSICPPHQERFYVWRTPNLEHSVPTVKHKGRSCDGLGSSIEVVCWSHYYPSWSNYCKGERRQVWWSTIQALFPNNGRFPSRQGFHSYSLNCFYAMNFNNCSGQPKHHIWTSLNHSGMV
jgi:hypothetical protein